MKDNKRYGFAKKMNKAGKTVLCAVLVGGLVIGGACGYGSFAGRNVQAASDNAMSLTKAEETDAGQETRSIADLVDEMMPSVVSITTKSVEEVENYYGIFNFYGYAPRTQREVSYSASGIIVGMNDDELLVVTNYHVVDDADVLSVCFCDNNAYEAKVKGTEEAKDLAVVAVPLKGISKSTLEDIKVATIGSSDDLRLGDQVIVIGNAMGIGQSVTAGIVSAKNRQVDENDKKNGVNLIQTDAAINPGNSGGALVNMKGEVVGISSSKLVDYQIEGMCYAIAISDVEDILEELMNEETREKVGDNHGVLGITATTVSSEANQVYGIPEGAYIVEVSEDGAADKAGLEPGGVITKFNGRSITGVDDLIEKLEYYEVGEKVDVTVAERHGDEYEETTYTVKLQESKDQTEKDAEDEDVNDDQERQDRKDRKDGKDDSEDTGDDGSAPDNIWGFDIFDDDGEEYSDDWDFGDGTFGEWH
jgi:serine protease Do